MKDTESKDACVQTVVELIYKKFPKIGKFIDSLPLEERKAFEMEFLGKCR